MALGAKSDSNSDSLSKALAAQVIGEGGSVNDMFLYQRHQGDLSVHRPSRCLIYSIQ